MASTSDDLRRAIGHLTPEQRAKLIRWTIDQADERTDTQPRAAVFWRALGAVIGDVDRLERARAGGIARSEQRTPGVPLTGPSLRAARRAKA